MAKQFNVPPVVFPSGGIPLGLSNPQRRRSVPSDSIQQHRSTSNSSPQQFLSFDIGTLSAGNISTGHSSLYASENFEYEEPLLDELGIHPGQIWSKTKSILNPFRVDVRVHGDADSDLSGPFLYYLLFGFFQLLSGKIQFGVILGWSVMLSIFLYSLFNMLAGRSGNLDLHRCASVVGYSMLPVVVMSAVSLFLPSGGMLSFALATVFVIWSTRICTRLIVSVAGGGTEEHSGLIAYACFLIYTILCMLVLF